MRPQRTKLKSLNTIKKHAERDFNSSPSLTSTKTHDDSSYAAGDYPPDYRPCRILPQDMSGPRGRYGLSEGDGEAHAPD